MTPTSTSNNAQSGSLATFFETLGDWSIFAWRTVLGIFIGRPQAGVIVPIFTSIGVASLPVVLVTGAFIGMVLAVQAYSQFHPYGFDAALGTITIGGILSELGPVLAAVMLAGRVGSSMAAELATMRITEQIDALSCLGVDPVHHLSTPRFLACLLLIPLLTVMADAAGIVGSTFICVYVYGVEAHDYWEHTQKFVGGWELSTGILKSIFFGGALALVSCYRGFTSQSGAAGVGRAATLAFVSSFVVIMALDFLLSYLLVIIRPIIWPASIKTGFG